MERDGEAATQEEESCLCPYIIGGVLAAVVSLICWTMGTPISYLLGGNGTIVGLVGTYHLGKWGKVQYHEHKRRVRIRQLREQLAREERIHRSTRYMYRSSPPHHPNFF